MYKLIILFILVQFAILARYIVFGAFDIGNYLVTYLLLVAAAFIYFYSKHLIKKEASYEPTNIASWSFLTRQRTFTIEKPLYKGD